MKKIINYLAKNLREEIQTIRRARGSRFLYLPNSLSLVTLNQIYLKELLNKYEEADKILINAVVRDLVNRKILLADPVSFTTYKVSEDIFYYDVYLKTYDNSIYCRGTSTDMPTAFAKAIGEVFERTSIKYPSLDMEKLEEVVKSVGEIRGDKKFINFGKIPKATNLQLETFPDFRIEDNDRFTFVKVRNILGEEVFVPRQAIFFGDKRNEEKSILQSTTHAAGAGHTFEMAFNSAFFEVLHRHYFLKSWYRGEAADLLDLSSLDINSELNKKVKALQGRGFKIHILDYRKETGVPTFICLLEKYGGYYCGGSSSLDLYYAVERSMDEAMSSYYWETDRSVHGANELSREYIDSVKTGFVDASLNGSTRIQLFANSYYVSKLDKFFLRGKLVKVNSFKFDKDDFDIKKYILEKFGPDCYYFEPRNRYLQDYDFHTVKMYVPNSYYFPLSEIYARPILQDGVEPVNISLNPFP